MIIDFANQKGGVAKSTTSINVAAGLAARGYKTLLIDVDPQENSTSVYLQRENEQMLERAVGETDNHQVEFSPQALEEIGLPPESFQFFDSLTSVKSSDLSLFGVLINGVPIQEVIIKTSVQNLDLIPAHIRMSEVDLLLAGVVDNRAARLRKALNQVKDQYDYIIIDTPPSLGMLTINAFVASDGVVIPISTAWWALTGLRQLLEAAMLVRQSELNPDLKILGILCTMADNNTNVSKDVETVLRQSFGRVVFESVIPKNVSLEEAHSRKDHIFNHAPTSKGAKAYQAFIDELVAR